MTTTLFFLCFNTFILLTLPGLGTSITTAISLAVFDVRPIGVMASVWSAIWYGVIVPAYLIVFGLIMWRLFVRQKRKQQVGPWKYGMRHADMSMPSLLMMMFVVGALYAPFFFLVLSPTVSAAGRSTNWPADMQLVEFTVCSTQVDESPLGGLKAHGRIVIELVNHSTVAIEKAVFSLSTGRDTWNRLEVTDIAPLETRHIEFDQDIGSIVCRDTKCPAKLYWDRVDFADESNPVLEHRPALASTKVNDCRQQESP